MSLSNAWNKLAEWLFKQRTETVVLLLMLGLVSGATVYGLPWATAEVKSHIKDINASHEKQSSEKIAAHAKEVDQIVEAFKRGAETADRMNERAHQLIDRLLESKGVRSEAVPGRKEFAVSPPPHLLNKESQ